MWEWNHVSGEDNYLARVGTLVFECNVKRSEDEQGLSMGITIGISLG